MEKLKLYIKQRCGSLTRAARELGISRVHLSTITNSRNFPGRKLALRIEKWSAGFIRAENLLGVGDIQEENSDLMSLELSWRAISEIDAPELPKRAIGRKPRVVDYDRLHEVLDYNTETGVFTWKNVPCNHPGMIGEVAGTKQRSGYVTVCIDGKAYLAHRLAWLYVHGYFPENGIDHINRIKDANWISNLREVSTSCNMRNAKLHFDNTSGVKGVHWDKQRRKWNAQIKVNYKQRGIGAYDDFDEAVCARLAVEQCLGWEGCDSSSPAYCYVQKMLRKEIEDGPTGEKDKEN